MTNRTIMLRPRRENEVDQESSNEAPRPLLVSATDAALVLAIGRTTLYEIVKSGDLTPIHIRRCVRFSMYEISQYVESLARRIHAQREATVCFGHDARYRLSASRASSETVLPSRSARSAAFFRASGSSRNVTRGEC
jgi:hypothetical protein